VTDALQTRPAPGNRQALPIYEIVVAAVTAVVAIILLAGPGGAFSGPSFVQQLTVVNDTDYSVTIDVSNAGHDEWMALGTAARHQTTVLQEVINQGNTWTFRVAAQGKDGGQFQFRRADLAHAGWSLHIPAAVGTRLQAAGATLSP
jgi:hypothetical protein